MLSGRRLDLLDPSPVDVEVEVLHQGRPARGLTATLYACGTRETVEMGRRGRARCGLDGGAGARQVLDSVNL